MEGITKVLATALAVTGIAAAGVAAGVPAQAAARPHACAVSGDRLTVGFGHGFKGNGHWAVPLVIGTKGKKVCTLSGSAGIRLLDRKGKVLKYRIVAGARGVTTKVGPHNQGVVWLSFPVGKGTLSAPREAPDHLPGTRPEHDDPLGLGLRRTEDADQGGRVPAVPGLSARRSARVTGRPASASASAGVS